MKFSWKWLNELVDLNNISIEEINQTLTLAGFEVEHIESKSDIQDQIIDLSITSNRADVSSMVGLAREVSTIFNVPINKSIYKTHAQLAINNCQQHTVKIKSNILLNFKLNTIQLTKKKYSPTWLVNYLNGCGIESTNILSDISEYINIKWGQDIEILDLGSNLTDSLKKEQIEHIISNDINSDDLKINDWFKLNNQNIHHIESITHNNSIISLLGVKSNPKLICRKNSSSIIIIGQICKREYIEKLTCEIQKRTEKINKHLKGISVNDFNHAYYETINLILTLNEGFLGPSSYIYNNTDCNTRTINIYEQDINNILGPYKHFHSYESSQTTIFKILQQLQFKPRYKEGHFITQIPDYRLTDITREIDIIEEIIRIYGFDKFMDKIPAYTKTGYISHTSKFIHKIRYTLRNLGLHEVIHYSLDNHISSNVKLYNPIIEDQNTLRSNLINRLVDTCIYNDKQKNSPLECFEIGKVFYKAPEDTASHIEEIYLAGIIGNFSASRKSWAEKNQALTWFQAKGLLEDFFDKLHANINWTDIKNSQVYICDKKLYHPYRTAIIYNQNTRQEIGIFGQINSRIKSKFQHSYNQYIFEINISHLINTVYTHDHLNYNVLTYSFYPYVTRDISLIIPAHYNAETVKNYILQQSNAPIESVKIFNEYNKFSQSQHIRNVGFRITYRSKDRTLNDKDIKKIDQDIQDLLKIKL